MGFFRMLYLPSLACLVLVISTECQVLSLSETKTRATLNRSKGSLSMRNTTDDWMSRRRFVVAVPAAAVSLSQNTEKAMALQKKNEALCGTGFFANIAQYKCTEIGDISDEGRAQPLDNIEEGSLQSLMDKMGMDKNMDISEENGKNKSDIGKVKQESKYALDQSSELL